MDNQQETNWIVNIARVGSSETIRVILNYFVYLRFVLILQPYKRGMINYNKLWYSPTLIERLMNYSAYS